MLPVTSSAVEPLDLWPLAGSEPLWTEVQDRRTKLLLLKIHRLVKETGLSAYFVDSTLAEEESTQSP